MAVFRYLARTTGYLVIEKPVIRLTMRWEEQQDGWTDLEGSYAHDVLLKMGAAGPLDFILCDPLNVPAVFQQF